MRPFPPEIALDEYAGTDIFTPSPALEVWAMETFIDENSPLCNPDHAHLYGANIGFLWTNVPNSRNQRVIAGTAEVPFFRGGKWQSARQSMQMQEWFGNLPDFVITLDARIAQSMSDAQFCALVEHELYHCAQQLDMFGMPKFDRNDRPKFAIRGHDVEEFVGVVRRYGIGTVANGEAFVDAAIAEPEIEAVEIGRMCGTCL